MFLFQLASFIKIFVACDAVDIDACHILLERSWQHDVNATHQGKTNIYMFTCEDKKIAMKPIPPVPKPTKEEKLKFISIYNRGEFLVESKETK